MGLLVGAKALNVGVPFIFKCAIDTLNTQHMATTGSAILSLGTASDTVATVATSLLIGCMYKNHINYYYKKNILSNL